MNRIHNHEPARNGHTPRHSSEWKKEVENTRRRMDGRLDTIADRLSPSALGENLISTVTRAIDSIDLDEIAAKISDAGASAADAIRRRPLPFALGVLALAAVFVPARKRHDESDDGDTTDEGIGGPSSGWDTHYNPGTQMAASPSHPHGPSTLVSRGDELERSSAGTEEDSDPTEGSAADSDDSDTFVDRLKERAAEAGQKVSEVADTGKERVVHASEKTAAWAKDTGRQASRAIRRGKRKVSDRFESGRENCPEALAFGALAVGLVGALLLPRTRAEDDLCGDSADQLKRKAKSAGKDYLNDHQLDRDGIQNRTEEAIERAERALGDQIDDHLAP